MARLITPAPGSDVHGQSLANNASKSQSAAVSSTHRDGDVIFLVARPQLPPEAQGGVRGILAPQQQHVVLRRVQGRLAVVAVDGDVAVLQE